MNPKKCMAKKWTNCKLSDIYPSAHEIVTTYRYLVTIPW